MRKSPQNATKRRRAQLLLAAAGTVILFEARAASAQDNWVVDQGYWDDPNNWSTGDLPYAGDTVYIVTAAGFQAALYDLPVSTLAFLTINNSSTIYGDTSYLAFSTDLGLVPDPILTVSGDEWVGGTNTGADGAGIVNQFDGTNQVAGYLSLGYNPGDNGSYNLNDATLSMVNANVEAVGVNGTGTFTQYGGLNNITLGSHLLLAQGPNSQGTYLLNAGTLNAAGNPVSGEVDEGIGYNGTGTFVQSGGINKFSDDVVVGFGSLGTYTLGAVATLTTTSGTEIIGLASGSTGVFAHNGGYNQAAELYIGSDAGSTGTYNLNSGTLYVFDDEYVGFSGTGTFTQTGGMNECDELAVGDGNGSTGAYNLSGGALFVNSIAFVGGGPVGLAPGGMASLTLSNTGQMTIQSNLTINNGTVSATNEIVGGQYESNATIVIGPGNSQFSIDGVGTVSQSAGSNSAAELYLGESYNDTGTYNQSGGSAVLGTVTVGTLPVNAGEITVPGGTGFLNVSNTGQMTVNSSLTLNNGSVATPNEIVGGGSAAASTIAVGPGIGGVGIFNQNGGTNTTVELNIGESGSTGTYDLSGGLASVADAMDVGIQPQVLSIDPPISLLGGTGYLTISSSGQLAVNNTLILSNGSVTVSAGESIGGGLVTYPANVSIEVGRQISIGGGVFNQNGGINTITGSANNLILGYSADTMGTYILSGGTVSVAGNEEVGDKGSGLFNQTGGLNTISGALSVSSLDSNYSTYNLSDPEWPDCTLMLTSSGYNFTIGAAGQFNIYGNINTPPANTLPAPGEPPSLPLTYEGGYLQDPLGAFNGPGQIMNDGGYVDPVELDLTGSFTQVGGIANIGQINDDGAISISGGLVVATTGEYVGNNATGTFTLSGGYNIIGSGNGLVVGNNSGSTGSYTLSATGVLTSGGSEIIGLSGVGGFDQTGGSNTIATNGFFYVTLGNNADSTGSYTLSGTGTLSSSYEFVGAAGVGTFNQSGGLNTVAVSVSIGNNPGGVGFYAMSAGALTTAQIADGPVGTATFTQTGGIVTVGAGGMQLGADAGSSGTYTLSGGTLTASNVYVGGSSSGPGGAGVLTVSAAAHFSDSGTLTVYKKGSANISGASASVGGLSITGGTVNVNTSIAINFASPSSDPINTIVSYLQSGYKGGAWTGTSGIISTNAAGSGRVTTLGYLDGNIDTTDRAQVAPNQILVKYTLVGDANLDGIVNFTDFAIVLKNFAQPGTDWAQGNFEYAANSPSIQATNFNDFADVLKNFLQPLPGGGGAQTIGGTVQPLTTAVQILPPVVSEVEPTSIPEPASLSLLAAGAAGLLARRRRRSPRG